MLYHAPTRSFVTNVQELEHAAAEFVWVIKKVRQLADLPLEPHKTDGPMESPHFAEQGIIDAARRLGIDLGVTRHGQLDVRDAP